jgi:hypothetical protein
MKLWPGARLMETEGLGHRAVVDDQAVRKAALEFLSST